MTKQQETEALFGGKEVTIQHLDKTSRQVTVRHLPIRQLRTFIDLQLDDNVQALAALLLGLDDIKELDCVTDESIERIVEIGDAINFDRAVRHINQKEARVTRLTPFLKPAAEAAASQAVDLVIKSLKAKGAELQNLSAKAADSSGAAAKSSSTKPSPG